MSESGREQIKDVMDKLASSEKYITYQDLQNELCNNDKDLYQSMRNIKSELKKSGVIEECGKSFRYKEKYRNYFKAQREKNAFEKARGEVKLLKKAAGFPIFGANNANVLNPRIMVEEVQGYKNYPLIQKFAHLVIYNSVVSFQYIPGFKQENALNVIAHLHVLKEFNNRWFLFGYDDERVKDGKCDLVTCWAIDRINDKTVKKIINKNWVDTPDGFYTQYFAEMVGVSRKPNQIPEKITIKTLDYRTHHHIKSKMICPNQVETKEFDRITQSGEFTITVIRNLELKSKLMSFGSRIKIEEPIGHGTLQESIKQDIIKLNRIYFSSEEQLCNK